MKLRIDLKKDETGYYVAECPALAGCVTQGRTVREAMANMREAISCWLCAADRKAGKGRKGKRIHRHIEV